MKAVEEKIMTRSLAFFSVSLKVLLEIWPMRFYIEQNTSVEC